MKAPTKGIGGASRERPAPSTTHRTSASLNGWSLSTCTVSGAPARSNLLVLALAVSQAAYGASVCGAAPALGGLAWGAAGVVEKEEDIHSNERCDAVGDSAH